jgi:hypothetical protein
MLPHRDIDHVLCIQRAAATLKPMLQRSLLYLHNHQQTAPPLSLSSPVQTVSSLLSTVLIEPRDYHHWTVSPGTVATRSAPFWGPLDRLSLGLLLREAGSTNYRPAMVLACCELILEALLNVTQPLDCAFDDLIGELRAEIESKVTGEERAGGETVSRLGALVSQSKRLIDFVNYGIQKLDLFPELERPSPFSGHDVRKVGPETAVRSASLTPPVPSLPPSPSSFFLVSQDHCSMR